MSSNPGSSTHQGERGLEHALAATERDAEAALVVARRLQSVVGAARKAALSGDLRALRRALSGAEDTLADAAEAIGQLREGWSLSEEDEIQLLASGAYTQELIRSAEDAGLAIYDQDGVLSSYPSLVRVLPRQLAVSIDRKPHRRIRPTALVAHLSALQNREPTLGVERFAETLHGAYRVITPEAGAMVRLVYIYSTLTLLPAAAREYGLQEFARDVYLLDRSGHATTKSGAQIRLSAGATSARDRRNLLVVVTREGVEKTYHGVEFVGGATR